MRAQLFIHMAWFALLATPAWPSSQVEFLPKGGRPFRLTFADPREIRMALLVQSDERLSAVVGNYFSLLGVGDDGAEWKAHFGLEGAGYFTMRQADRRFPLETADGLIGAYLEGGTTDWQIQLRYTHISAHLADGSVSQAIAYSRETAHLRLGWSPDPRLLLYSGFSRLVHSVPQVPGWGFQLGGSYFLPVSSGMVTPFAALDLKWREEVKTNPSFSAQLGVALNNPPEAYRSFRFFYSYFTGTDSRGQFFERPYTSHSLGVEMQI